MPRRSSIIRLANASVYSGQTADRKPDQKQGKANSRGGNSYAPTDLGQDEITLGFGNQQQPPFRNAKSNVQPQYR